MYVLQEEKGCKVSKKKITFKKKGNLTSSLKEADQIIDRWVMGDQAQNEPTPSPNLPPATMKEETYRFTVVMPSYLHRRIKKTCAIEGVSMKERIIEILEEKFPES